MSRLDLKIEAVPFSRERLELALPSFEVRYELRDFDQLLAALMGMALSTQNLTLDKAPAEAAILNRLRTALSAAVNNTIAHRQHAPEELSGMEMMDMIQQIIGTAVLLGYALRDER